MFLVVGFLQSMTTCTHKKGDGDNLFMQVNLLILLLSVDITVVSAASNNKYSCVVEKSVTLVSMVYDKAMKAAEAMEKIKTKRADSFRQHLYFANNGNPLVDIKL